MFGFFKKKQNEEELLNKGIFLYHFSNIFDDFDISKLTLEDKMCHFPGHLASIVTEKAISSNKSLYELDSYQKTASFIIFHQTLLNIVDFIGYKDKNVLLKIISNVGLGMLCKDSNNPTPQERADFALSSTTYVMLGKEHLYILESISDDCLEWLFHREDKSISNLVVSWQKIINIISN